MEGGKLNSVRSRAEYCAEFTNHRLCVTDVESGLRFLVDTGANVSVIPRPKKAVSTSNYNELGYSLFAANGTPIKTFGVKTLLLNFRLKRTYRWTFVIADVSQPILGADFLSFFGLMVDMNARKVIDSVTRNDVIAVIVSNNTDSVNYLTEKQPFYDILKRYPDITRPVNFKDTPKHSIVHHIETTGPPVYARARPLPPDRYKKVKAEFDLMLKLGICRPSKSAWASPLHVVPKKDGSLRPCGDYRQLNARTKPDRYPIPRLQDFTYILAGKKIFSRIDVNRAYHYIPIADEDIEKSAIVTPLGLFEFPRMTFGLRNAAQTFQRFMNHTVLKDLDFVFGYLDDVIIASDNSVQHREHLDRLFARLNEFGLTINLTKCCFGQPELEFLGYHVNTQGIKPSPEKVKAILEFPKPRTIEQLRRFLGMVNFYRSHLESALKYQAVLNNYLIKSTKKDKTVIQWSREADKAFVECKAKLGNAALLSYPIEGAKMALMVDASDCYAGGVLQQRVKGNWKPLGYFSKRFTDTQRKYSTYDRELLSIFLAIVHFRNMFEGRELTIFTDHKPLTFAFSKLGSDKETPRRTRQLLFISEFTTDIRHISGSENTVADALSRIETISGATCIDYAEVAREQSVDSELAHALRDPVITSRLKRVRLPDSTNEIYCDGSTGRSRPYLPLRFRKQAFDAMHGLSHPGIRASRLMVKRSFYWPSMNRDVGDWAKACIQCQRAKTHKHTHSEVGHFPNIGRFKHLHIDIVGPLPTSPEGYKYLVTMIDRVTGWPEAFPACDITADTVARVLYEGWVARFGCPWKITSDQGRQFESAIFAELMKYLGVTKLRTTPYHPQSNGKLERWHRNLKAALKARLTTSSWVKVLPSIMLGLRAVPRSDTGVSAAEITLGHVLRLPGEFYDSSSHRSFEPVEYVRELRDIISNLKPSPTEQRDSRAVFVHPDLRTCEMVFVRVDAVRKPLQPPYDGPYRVIKRGSKVFTIQLPGRQSQISIDRLKPAYILSEDVCYDSRSADITPPQDRPGIDTERNVLIPDNVRPAPVARSTRSGRIIKRPARY
jgi:transposase InsO family protein/predicted aspartyl protease